MLSRGTLLRGGAGLVVAFGIPLGCANHVAPQSGGEPHAPFAPVSPASLDSWLSVAPDGIVTVFTGRIDSGQGKETVYAQFVAEELDVAFDSVRIVMADTALTPDQGASTASDGIVLGSKPLRHAAAQARHVLLDLASKQFGVAATALSVNDGVVSVTDAPAKKVTYGQLIGGKRFDTTLRVVGSGSAVDVIGDAPLKDPRTYKIVGKSIPRLDIPAKVTGTYDRVQNVRIPGMLHGRLVMPAAYGATLLSVQGPAQPVDGFVQLVRKGNFVGVVAKTEWAAIVSASAVQTTWSNAHELVTGDIFAAMRKMPISTSTEVVPQLGNVDTAIAGAPKKLTATYNFPMQNHGMIGPSCAIADVQPGQVTLWSGTQYPALTRGHVAQLLGIPVDDVRLIWHQTSGCYGRMTMDDAAPAAALLSAAAGKPVRVQFMRNDEHVWEPHMAPYTFSLRGALDAQGRMIAWDQELWTWGLGPLVELPWILEGSAPSAPGPLRVWPIGGGQVQMYVLPNQRSVAHRIAKPMVRSIDMRSPGFIQTNFANESFVDELAAAAASDPIEFRIKHAAEPRSVAVLRAVAKLANWDTRPSPARGTNSNERIAKGRGVAVVAGQKLAWVATIAEVEVDRQTGVVQPTQLYVAVDTGLVVNPDGLRNQVEGATLFGAGRALKEQLTWNASSITSTDWISYPILTFTETPAVDITVIDRIDQPSGGIGEAPNTTPAAAIGNAVFDATGTRLRQVPFTPDRVKAALNARNS